MTRHIRSIDARMLQRAQRIAAITLASLAIAAPAAARAQAPARAAQQQPGDKAGTEAAFKRADANQDGKLSKEEAARLPAVAARFDELDTDKDGSLTLAEFLAGNPTR